MSGITGFDMDNQRIAKAQMEATRRLAEAIEALTQEIQTLGQIVRTSR